MTKKLAKRWVNQNKWNISKFNLGMLKDNGQFAKQFFLCKRTLDSILYRKFN